MLTLFKFYMRNFIFCCLALLMLPVFGQAQTIRGKVVDDAGLPLPGVSIVNTASNATSITDLDGNFAIAAQAGESIKFTYIGFQDQTVPAVEGMSVAMKSSATSLEEVVVVGYGTQKRKDLTTSIATVKAEQIVKQPAFNALQSIQGKAAGVNIIANDAPGANPTIMVRGLGTASAGRGVLYVIDGVMTGTISNINPNDIETFDILKDASGAAIYGATAANGVVIITTKKGKAGKTVVKADSFYGAKSMLNPVRMANAQQYTTFFNENPSLTGGTNGYTLAANQAYDTDWYDVITDNIAFIQSNNVSFAGGGENSQYYFSVNTLAEDGLLENQKNWRNTIRGNSSFTAFDKRLKISQNFNLTLNKANVKPFGAFDTAYRQSPLVPVYYPTGQYGQPFVNQTTGIVTYEAGPGESIGELNSHGNPVAAVDFANEEQRSTTIQGNIEAELKLFDGLKVTTRFGATKFFGRNRIFTDQRGLWLADDPTRTGEEYDNNASNNPGVITWANNALTYSQSEDFRFNWDTFLTYEKSFGRHNFTVTAGVTKEKRDDMYNSSIQGFNVPNARQFWNINQASTAYTNISTQTFLTPLQILSYFGRIQYNFDGKYFLTGNIRQDGISSFRQNRDYWATFPSVSGGWVLTKEKFMEGVKGVDFLKIRAGYGELGNAAVPFNIQNILFAQGSTSTNYVLGPNQDLVQGAAVSSPAMPIGWEVTQEISAGLDFEFLDSRLSGSVDYYNRKNRNAIMLVRPILNSGNSTDYYDHGGVVRNEGLELSLNWKDRIGQDFTYSIGVNGANNKNTLESVKPAYDGQIGGSLGNSQITKRLQAGQPVYSWWMYEADGVWQSQAEIDANPHIGTPQVGQLRYKDQNGDGQIDDRDKKFFGNYVPKYNYGINISLAYKGFDFSADGYGAGGNKVYNGLKGTRINGGENITYDRYANRWTGPGTSNTDPGANADNLASSYYLEDGDFFRINNITLGYTFNDVFKGVSKIRVYGTAQNAFLFTKYTGFTPELQGSGLPNETAGIELSAYPNVKTFLFGVNLEF